MNRVIKIFGYQFYLKEFLIILFSYLLMENVFSWLIMPNSVILLLYEKILSLVIFGIVLYNFTNLKKNEKIYIGLFCFVMIRLVFVSIFNYGNVFEQFTMFTILFPVVYTIYIKCICRSLELDFLEFLAKFYIGIYVIMMVIYGRGFSFSLASVEMDDYGPFSGDSRIIHARSILMMIIPMLWYFNKFLKTYHWKHFLLFAFCLVVIVIHQHRSVWASAIFASMIYLIGVVRNKLLSIPKIFNLVFASVIVVMLLGIIMIHVAPQFTDFLSDRFSEILDPTREGGTGEFRQQQRDVYLALATKKPVFGWTFEGFDMPNPLVDWWPEKTGQHFHEGYVEMLFYHGIVGFLLKYWFLFYLTVKVFNKKISQESIILIAFSISGLIFSFSYVLPLVFWGHVGLCLYYLEKDEVVEQEEEEPILEEEMYEEELVPFKF
jgi:hypothetical protein